MPNERWGRGCKEQGRHWKRRGQTSLLILEKKKTVHLPTSSHVTILAVFTEVYWSCPQTTKALNYSSSPSDGLGGTLKSPTSTIILKYNISICNKSIYIEIYNFLLTIYFNIQIIHVRGKKKKNIRYCVVIKWDFYDLWTMGMKHETDA